MLWPGGAADATFDVSGREYLIDASAYWCIDRGLVLAAAWRDHLERGLAWICPPTVAGVTWRLEWGCIRPAPVVIPVARLGPGRAGEDRCP